MGPAPICLPQPAPQRRLDKGGNAPGGVNKLEGRPASGEVRQFDTAHRDIVGVPRELMPLYTQGQVIMPRPASPAASAGRRAASRPQTVPGGWADASLDSTTPAVLTCLRSTAVLIDILCEPICMPLLAGLFHFEVEGFQIERQALDRTVTIKAESYACRLDFPTSPNAFEFTTGTFRLGDVVDPRDYVLDQQTIDHGGQAVEVRVVRLVVNMESGLSPDSFDSENGEQKSEYTRLYHEMGAIAREALLAFTDRVRRMTPQRWLQTEGVYPKQIGLTTLFEASTGNAFNVMIGGGTAIHVLPEGSSISSGVLTAIETSMQDRPSATEEALLGEAIYLSHGWDASRPNQAVLVAAMSIELGCKRLLRELANDAQRPLVDLLLDNPRDWSMSALSLFTKAMAALDLDKGIPDRRQINKRVAKLFETRNAVVHRGLHVSECDARNHVETSIDAYALLQTMESNAKTKTADSSPGAASSIVHAGEYQSDSPPGGA